MSCQSRTTTCYRKSCLGWRRSRRPFAKARVCQQGSSFKTTTLTHVVVMRDHVLGGLGARIFPLK
jgi:hypothetical protein